MEKLRDLGSLGEGYSGQGSSFFQLGGPNLPAGEISSSAREGGWFQKMKILPKGRNQLLRQTIGKFKRGRFQGSWNWGLKVPEVDCLNILSLGV